MQGVDSQESKLLMLDEPATGRLTIQYSPDADTRITENPPRFTWLPTLEDGASYAVRISKDTQYQANCTEIHTGISLNFFTPEKTLDAGDYVWSYAVWSEEKNTPLSNWSKDRNFTVPAALAETPLPSRKTRFAKSNKDHPRLWLDKNRISSFKKSLATDPRHCTWNVFYEKSARPWICLLYTSPSPRDKRQSRMPSSA